MTTLKLKPKDSPELTLTNVERIEIEFNKNIFRVQHKPSGQVLFYETEWNRVDSLNFDGVEKKAE